MDFNINIKRLERFNRLIFRKQTGSPPEFAAKMNVSEAIILSKRAIFKYVLLKQNPTKDTKKEAAYML